jgi:putative nucleotidyltransferase with HDIG domain
MDFCKMEKKILIVEDEKIVAEDIKQTLQKFKYEIIGIAEDATQALELIKQKEPDLVLMDIVLSGIYNGIQLTEKINKQFDLPVVYMTAYSDTETLQRATVTEPYGYLIKPFNDRELRANIEMALYKHNVEKRLSQSHHRLSKVLEQTINALVLAIEMRDSYTAGHQRRVSDLSNLIATEMNLPQEKIDAVTFAAMLHDIGKIHIPISVLNNSNKLSDKDRMMIRNHPKIGYSIIKDIDFNWPIADIILQHHEKLDGSGYPFGLKGEEIMLEARILCVSDVIEAMVNNRPYRPSLGLKEAINELQNNKGTLYDEKVVDTCIELIKRDKMNI